MAGWLLYSLHSALILVFVSADQLKKTEGQNVTLPCKLPSSNQVIVVQWSRTDLGSEYVLRYRDEQIDPFNQHQSFKNRVDLKDTNMEDGDVSLVLKDLRTQDGGTYECKVVQRGTGSNRMNLISTITLEVEALPPDHSGKLNIDQKEDDQHSETAEKNGGTHETPPTSTTDQLKKTEGQNVTLPCKLPSSNQVIVVQWSRTDLGSEYVLRYRDEQIDPFNQHQSFKNRADLKDTNMEDGDVSLVLKDLRTQDGGTYECKVVQRGTGSNRMNLISTITLEVEALPPDHSGKLNIDQKEDDQHSETAEKNGGTHETPPTSTTAAGVERSRVIPAVIASLSVIAVLVAVVVSVIVWRKRRPDLPPDKEQTSMI